MVERPIKKSDLPAEEAAAKTDRPERKEKRNRKEKREEKKPPIPPALIRGPKPQPKKVEVPPETSATEELPADSD